MFLGYIVSSQGIQVDQVKVKPTSIQRVRNLHGLASFYRRFVKNLSSLMAPMTEVLKTRSLSILPKLRRPLKASKKDS